MTHPLDLNAPWRLHFDRDGTEDVAVVCDAGGNDLATSRPFWLPEGDDPVPPMLAAVRLMVVAPQLLEALDYLLQQTVDQDLKHGIGLSEGEQDARDKALAAIAEAMNGAPEPRQPIVIEVRGGVVQDVRNVPPGIDYEIRDYDNREGETTDEGGLA